MSTLSAVPDRPIRFTGEVLEHPTCALLGSTSLLSHYSHGGDFFTLQSLSMMALGATAEGGALCASLTSFQG
jgi:hypothetical protein